MKRLWLLWFVLMALAACQPEAVTLPTQAVLPSATPDTTSALPTESSEINSPTPNALQPTVTPTQVAQTETTTATDTPAPSLTPTLSDTPSPTAGPSNTPPPTRTLRPIIIPTLNPTRVVVASATAFEAERPVFATLTPAPPQVAARPTSTGTPEMIADVLITEAQFQEEMDRLARPSQSVADAIVDFVPEGVRVELTAQIGAERVSGALLYTFDLVGAPGGLNNFVAISPQAPGDFVMDDGSAPSEAFVDIAYEDLFDMVVNAFDFILNQRLGEGRHNLEFIRLNDELMGVSLLVPES